MPIPRRRFLELAGGVGALPAMARVARAQDYPTRPVRWIVGVVAGGNLDIVARLMGQWLTEQFGQTFVIENRPGAGTMLAAELVVRSPPDGATVLMASTGNAINSTLYQKLSFDFIRDIAPVGGISRVPLMMAVNASVPAGSVPEFVAYAKAHPGKLSMASGGTGSSAHLAGELLKMMAGIDMVHVPYRGGAPALTDLIGGRVHVIFSPVPETLEHVRGGKIRALALTTTTRAESMPEVPTMSEFYPGFEASAWNGMGAPRDTPAAIIERLNAAINAGLADPKRKARLAELGGDALPGSPADFGRLIAEETAKWAKVIRAANVRAE